MRWNLRLLCFLFFSFCASLLFFSCSAGTLESLDPIAGKILFKVSEGHTQPYCDCEPEIVLYMETEKIYPCCNFTIKSNIDSKEKKITVTLRGIFRPEICLTALGPARSQNFLNLSEGVYSLVFVNGLLSDNYLLDIKPDKIEVKSMTPMPNFTEPQIRIFWRYPRNSFVYLCGTTAETTWIWDDFLSRLRAEIDLQEFRFPGLGENPYPPSPQGYQFNMPARYFIYKTAADFDKAGEILKVYSKTVLPNLSGVGLSLTNWKGKMYASWLF